MPKLNSANNARSTLTANINNSVDNFDITDASLFPAPPFRLTVQGPLPSDPFEIMEVGTVIGNSFSGVKRGVEGTTPISHNAGDRAECRFTAGTLDKLWDDYIAHRADYIRQPGYGTTAGSANTYTLTLSPAPTYVDGLAVSVKINVTNTDASTININSLGAKTIKAPDGANVAAGDLLLNSVYSLRYNGTNFILQGKGGVVLTGNIGNYSLTGHFSEIAKAHTFFPTVGVYEKVAEIKIKIAGSFTIKFDARYSDYLFYARLYKNGVAIGIETALSTGYATFSENFNGIIKDDNIELRVRKTQAITSFVYIKNFLVCGDLGLGIVTLF